MVPVRDEDFVLPKLLHGNSETHSRLILGSVVLFISLIVVGLIDVGSSASDVITKFNIYVNPEAARVCTVARNGFSFCLTLAGLLGFLICLATCCKKKKADERGDGFSFGLTEASNLSYAFHATVLVFICIIGIVSRRITVDPEPGILIQLTLCELANNHAVTIGSRVNDTTRRASARSRSVHPKERSHATKIAEAVSRQKRVEHQSQPIVPVQREKMPLHQIESRVSNDEIQVQKEKPLVLEKEPVSTQEKSEASDVVASAPVETEEAKPTPETSATTMPYVTAGARPRSFIVPNFDLMQEHPEFHPDDSYVSSAVEGIDFGKPKHAMGFDQRQYLTSFLPSEDLFGVISRDSILENVVNDVPHDVNEIPDGVYSADLERKNTLSLDSGYLPMLSKRRVIDTAQVPVPKRAQNETMQSMLSITPDVPQEPPAMNHPELKPSRECDDGSCPSYMAELQKRIRRCWFPPKICTAPKSPIAKVHFTISSSGEVSNLKLFKSSGIAIYDASCLKAVESASPMKSLPVGAPQKVDIEFTFDLNVLGFYNTSTSGIDHLVKLGSIKQTSDRSNAFNRSKSLDLCKLDTFPLTQHINRRLSRVWAEPKNRGWVTLQYVIHGDGAVTNVRTIQSSGVVPSERAAETALIHAYFEGVVDPPGRRLADYFDILGCDSALVETQFRGAESSTPRIQSNIVELTARGSR